MAEIKVSQLPEATQINDEDLLMIVQGNTNKKITKANAKFASGDEIFVGDTLPSGDDADSIKFWLTDDDALEGEGSYISNEYGTSQEIGYSQEYSNNVLGVPTLIKERNYASGWTNEIEIPANTKWLYLIVNGDSCENVFITPTILATYTTSAPYFIANKNGLVYQWCNDNGTIKGLFRSEGGTNTSIKIYAIK